MTALNVISLTHFVASLFVAFAFLVSSIATLIIGFKLSRNLKRNDREAWVALGGKGLLFWNSMPTLLSRLKIIIPELDDELATQAKAFVKIMKSDLWLLGIFVVLMMSLGLY